MNQRTIIAFLAGAAIAYGYDHVKTSEKQAQQNSTSPITLQIAREHDTPVVMYSASWCNSCKRVREHFQSRQIPFTEYDTEKNQKGIDDYARLNGKAVPLLIVNGIMQYGLSSTDFPAALAKPAVQ